MLQFGHHLVNFLKNEDGPTAVEYAVMLALIIAMCITSITAFGSTTNNSFTNSGQRIKTGS
jgi:pilus assembly protein Flp/PilA